MPENSSHVNVCGANFVEADSVLVRGTADWFEEPVTPSPVELATALSEEAGAVVFASPPLPVPLPACVVWVLVRELVAVLVPVLVPVLVIVDVSVVLPKIAGRGRDIVTLK
jgi:hypothetical protein